jgi:hypothetical protein
MNNSDGKNQKKIDRSQRDQDVVFAGEKSICKPEKAGPQRHAQLNDSVCFVIETPTREHSADESG